MTMMVMLTTSAYDAFNGHRVFDNTVRLFIIMVGIVIGMIGIKVALTGFLHGQRDTAWGSLAFALVVVNPSIRALFNFGEPLFWPSTVIYVAGLVAAAISLGYRITMSGPWLNVIARRRHRDAKADRRQDRQDRSR